jgi:hypothetical protein
MSAALIERLYMLKVRFVPTLSQYITSVAIGKFVSIPAKKNAQVHTQKTVPTENKKGEPKLTILILK